MNVLTSTTEDRSNIPNHRNSWLGRLPCSLESFLPSRGQPPKLFRVRGREHRVSTLPTAIARSGDFAPTPIASGTSCRKHRSLPCPERRGEKTMQPPPAHACIARAAKGPCDTGLPRRDPMLRSPRGLLSLGRFAMRNGSVSRESELTGIRESAFFTSKTFVRGTLARDLPARPFRQGAASCPVAD